MSNEDLYTGREQTLVKHYVLKTYLESFAYIVGKHYRVLTYVDCFSGPWNARGENLEDSWFSIALSELRKAKYKRAAEGNDMQLRCFFLEVKRDAYDHLQDFASTITDAEVETRNAALEDSIDEIREFVKRGGEGAFSFIFIDPTGWTGFDMNVIAPILRLRPGEVLINFMTEHIRRFLNSPLEVTQESLRGLIGSSEFRDKVQGLASRDREDVILEEYMRNVGKMGEFDFVCSAVVLHPDANRTYFHLIYATRHLKGVEVFKRSEKAAMGVQEESRAKVHQRRRVARSGQFELLESHDFHDRSYYESLRERYIEKARNAVLAELNAQHRVPYDVAWALAMAHPFAQEVDLRKWIDQWQRQGLLRVEGKTARQRVLSRDKGHVLEWT